MELAQIVWAQWNGSSFVTPVHDSTHPNWNQAELQGGFGCNDAYLTDGDALSDGHVYSMMGIVALESGTSRAPHRAPGDKQYIVYPLTMIQTTTLENEVITGVMNVAGVREVAAVEYVNLAGQRSCHPWQGVNIVVTRYTDGTVTTAKECK